MATIAPALLKPAAALTNTAQPIYTVPNVGQAVIRRAVFTNIDTAPHQITVHRVPSGGSPSASNIVVSAYRLAPGQAYIASELGNMVLNAGDSIYAFADLGAVVNVTMSGITF